MFPRIPWIITYTQIACSLYNIFDRYSRQINVHLNKRRIKKISLFFSTKPTKYLSQIIKLLYSLPFSNKTSILVAYTRAHEYLRFTKIIICAFIIAATITLKRHAKNYAYAIDMDEKWIKIFFKVKKPNDG